VLFELTPCQAEAIIEVVVEAVVEEEEEEEEEVRIRRSGEGLCLFGKLTFL
jgi:hypothetical protein